MRLGQLERQAIDFARRVGTWHSFGKDTTTKRVIASLRRKGLVDVNAYHQFQPTWKEGSWPTTQAKVLGLL